MNEEIYDDWYSDNEKTLKEDFIMSFNNQALREWIQEHYEEEFLEYFEQGWIDFKDERFNNDMEQ